MIHSTHHVAPTAASDGWGLIVDIPVRMEIKYPWIVVYASVMLVMLVRTFHGLNLPCLPKQALRR